MTPSALDIFDPFDDLDRMMSRNLRWIDRPDSWVQSLAPVVPQKYRISVDCAGFQPESIKTEMKDQNGKKVLCIAGHEVSGTKGSEHYLNKELRKTYTLPENIEVDKIASFMGPGGQFVVEFPLKETASTPNLGLLPQIVDIAGIKQVQMKFPIPANVDPNKVQVSVKDRDLIMRVEDKCESPDSFSRVHIYTRTTLPDNTDFNQLKCVYDNNQLCISAPINTQYSAGSRNIPLEMKQQQQQQLYGQQQQQYGQQQQYQQGQQQSGQQQYSK
jgi:HSP20 family molecular chaperone IbpA